MAAIKLTIICVPASESSIAVAPQLAFAAKDGSFAATEQCNGCGGCLKQTPTMCPTYLATARNHVHARARQRDPRDMGQREN